MLKSHRGIFANWSNNKNIQIGAIGFVDHYSGRFTLLSDQLVNNPSYFENTKKSEKWEFSSNGVSKSTGSVKLDGSYTDPKTGMTVKAGQTHTWMFSNAESIAATYHITKESFTHNPHKMIKDNWDILRDVAKDSKNWDKQNKGIYQGFGVITGVLWANRGVGMVSDSKNQSYSMTTTVDFFTPKKDSISVSPRIFKETDITAKGGFVFPINSDAEDLVPVAFTFTSIDGKHAIIDWTKKINTLQLRLDSKMGSTYKTYWTATYINDGKEHTESGNFTAPLSTDVFLPKHTKNLTLEITLPGLGILPHNKCHYFWHDPINEWIEGYREIQTYGIYPANGKCEITKF